MLSRRGSPAHYRPTAQRLLLACGLWGLWGCEAELYHDLTERHANEALSALQQAGLHAGKQASGRSARGPLFTLTVPRSEESHALAVLVEQGLPAAEPSRGQAGKLAILPSDARAEQLAAREAALADTLESLPQVSHARVHITQAEPDPLLPTAQLRPTAAVVLRTRGPLPVKPADVSAIVSRSVIGLDPSDVSVLITQTTAKAPMEKVESGRNLVNMMLGGLCGLLAAVAGLLGYLLYRSRKKEPAHKTSEHTLHALTSS